MIDFAAKVHYKVHFDVLSKEGTDDLLYEIISVIANWLKNKHKKAALQWNWKHFRKFGQFKSDDGSVYASTTSFYPESGERYWACRIVEYPYRQYAFNNGINSLDVAPRIWTTEIGYEQRERDRATISFVVYYTDKAGFFGPLDSPPPLSTPRIVYDMLYSPRFSCVMGNITLSGRVLSAKVGEADRFAALLMDESRLVPILLMIPNRDEDAEISHQEMQRLSGEVMRNVIGNAIVYCADDAIYSAELSYFLNKQYWCYPGQMRIYWPNMNPSNPSDGQRHRYVCETQIQDLGSAEVIGIIRRVLSQDIRYYESREMFRMEDCADLYKASKIEELRMKYSAQKELTRKTQEQSSQYEVDYYKLTDENYTLRSKNQALSRKLSEIKQINYQLENTYAAYAQQYKAMQEKEASLENIRSIAQLPKTPYEIGDYFRKIYGESIDFTERGIASLKHCRTTPSLLWECLYAIANYLTPLYNQNCVDIKSEFHNLCGWEMAGREGHETRKNNKLMALRKDVYEGREISIEPHVKRGRVEGASNFIRVYYCYDVKTSRIVIGHVGSHLDNYTTSLL